MVVYTNADFISLNEENLTYSVLVEDKGKIAYIGYNTPLCYRDAKAVDLEGKAVLPAVNDLIPVDCKDAGCAVLAVGECDAQRSDGNIPDVAPAFWAKVPTLPSWTKTFSRTLPPRWKPCT